MSVAPRQAQSYAMKCYSSVAGMGLGALLRRGGTKKGAAVPAGEDLQKNPEQSGGRVQRSEAVRLLIHSSWSRLAASVSVSTASNHTVLASLPPVQVSLRFLGSHRGCRQACMHESLSGIPRVGACVHNKGQAKLPNA